MSDFYLCQIMDLYEVEGEEEDEYGQEEEGHPGSPVAPRERHLPAQHL